MGNAYTIAIEWQDDTQIIANAIVSSNGAKQTSSGSTLIVRNVTRAAADSENYSLTALDSNNNTATYSLTLDRQTTDISVSNVESNDDSSVINTEISKGMDRSSVLFEKENANGVRSVLEAIRNNSPIKIFPLSSNQQNLSGGTFLGSTALELHDSK